MSVNTKETINRTKRADSNASFKVGDKVVCYYAASFWFSVGEIYDVVPHPENKHPSVQASDGFYDLLSMTISRFEFYDPKKHKPKENKCNLSLV